MTKEFEIIISQVKEGGLTDCLGKPNTRCLSGLQKNVWMIQGSEGLSAYYDLTQRIYKTPQIQNNYTVKHVEKVLDTLILEAIQHKTVSEKNIVSKAKQHLPAKQLESFDISRNIFGINLSKNYRKIGPFIFQKGKNTYSHYFRGHPSKFGDFKKYMSPFAVRLQIKSVTRERAVEIADNTFENLEYLFAFILGGKDSGHEVRILRQTKENMLFYIMKSGDGQISIGRSRENLVHNQIDLNDHFFKKKNIQRLFSLVVPNQQNSIESRLNKAISWIGKGVISNSSIESIISYCSALESILIRDSKTIISPSIVASLSEYCAFLLGAASDSRKDIIGIVKEIYSERSAGTHGGKIYADAKIERTALHISRLMVFRLLELYPKEITTEQELIDYVDKIKYS
jgi:hypothetical protein